MRNRTDAMAGSPTPATPDSNVKDFPIISIHQTDGICERPQTTHGRTHTLEPTLAARIDDTSSALLAGRSGVHLMRTWLVQFAGDGLSASPPSAFRQIHAQRYQWYIKQINDARLPPTLRKYLLKILHIRRWTGWVRGGGRAPVICDPPQSNVGIFVWVYFKNAGATLSSKTRSSTWPVHGHCAEHCMICKEPVEQIKRAPGLLCWRKLRPAESTARRNISVSSIHMIWPCGRVGGAVEMIIWFITCLSDPEPEPIVTCVCIAWLTLCLRTLKRNRE